jgi:hypothetical protein
MDRTEKPKGSNEFANDSEVAPPDAPALVPNITGCAASGIEGSHPAEPVGARPPSEITDGPDAGSGANETVDGLTSVEEAVRLPAEDTPIGASEAEPEDLPVFERGQALKV